MCIGNTDLTIYDIMYEHLPVCMRGNIVSSLVGKTGTGLALQEILYGFIMALIFVTAARVGILKYDDANDLIILIVGMNITWGAIDAVAFYFIDVMNQKKYIHLLESEDIDRQERIDTLYSEFGGTPLDVLDPKCQRAVCESMLTMEVEDESERAKDRREMRHSAIACFIITASTIIPVIVPLLLIDDIMDALLMSSCLSAVVLFFVGYMTGDDLGLNRMKFGLVLTIISWAITIVATFTGG